MMSQDTMVATAFIIPLILAITMHEAAHGFVAYLCGDDTAKRLGRVTFNPIKHVDPLGTIIFPGLLYLSSSPFMLGWAKPVPVNFRGLKNQRVDTLLVAIAGPMMNILLALISALLLHLDHVISPEKSPWFFMNLYSSVTVNVVLATFNMLPILPLDGGRVLGTLLPRTLAASYAKTERLGMAIILLIFMLPTLLPKGSLNLSHYLIYVPADALRDLILLIAGIGTTH